MTNKKYVTDDEILNDAYEAVFNTMSPYHYSSIHEWQQIARELKKVVVDLHERVRELESRE